MNSLERFYATIERKPVDRPAIWTSSPAPQAQKGLFELYGVDNIHDFQIAAGDDLYFVDVPYKSENASAIYAAFDWYQNGSNIDPQHRTLTADGCFKNAEELSDLNCFDWPEPAKYIDPAECLRRAEKAPEGRAVLAQLWSCHFQDACAAFGMQDALINMVSNPEIYKAVDAKIVEFYLKANEAFLEATKGKIHAILIGNDFGSQLNLMLSREMIHEFVMPGAKKLIDQAHSYGVKVIYHSCGAVVNAIDELIAVGVDAVHPIQPTAAGMEPENLKAKFGDRISFCGGVDIQHLLVKGTPEEVRQNVRYLREQFPTGLILSPSQGVIMDDVPPENIKAMLDEARKA